MYHWLWDVSHAPHHRYMLRSFSSNTNEGRSKSKRQQNYELSGKRIATDPFATLGIIRSPTLKFTTVKSTFLKIAMKYHPDTIGHCSEAEQEANKDLFVSARKAFESIMADPDGMAILKTEAHDYVEEEEDFEEWFRTETGYDMPFMDAATMKEVAEMTDTVGGGLDRDGGMWTLARMVANTVKEGGDGKSVLQLDAGVIRDRAIDGILRRKRKR
jgi:DnaJ-class molecular chaperone